MDPSTLAAEPRRPKPARWWVAVTLAAGAIGSMATIAAAGRGVYDVAPFVVELRAQPAALGKTEFALRPLELQPGTAEAGTHAAPIVLGATIVDVTEAFDLSDARLVATPHDMATFMSQEGKDAIRSFGMKLIALAVAGGATAGFAISFGRWRRIAGGALAGLLTLAVVGLLVQQTYDKEEFRKTSWRYERVQPPTDLPTGILSS